MQFYHKGTCTGTRDQVGRRSRGRERAGLARQHRGRLAQSSCETSPGVSLVRLVCAGAQTPWWPGLCPERGEQVSGQGPCLTQELQPHVCYRHSWLKPRLDLGVLQQAVQTSRCFTDTLLMLYVMQTHSEKVVPDPVLKILKDKSKVKDRRWQKPTDSAQTVRCVGIATGRPDHSSFH